MTDVPFDVWQRTVRERRFRSADGKSTAVVQIVRDNVGNPVFIIHEQYLLDLMSDAGYSEITEKEQDA